MIQEWVVHTGKEINMVKKICQPLFTFLKESKCSQELKASIPQFSMKLQIYCLKSTRANTSRHLPIYANLILLNFYVLKDF